MTEVRRRKQIVEIMRHAAGNSQRQIQVENNYSSRKRGADANLGLTVVALMPEQPARIVIREFEKRVFRSIRSTGLEKPPRLSS